MEISFEILTQAFSKNFFAYWDYIVKYAQTPNWSNHFYWIIFWFIFCFSLETILPKQQDYPTVKRKNFWLDLFYIFFNDFLVAALGFYAATVVVEMIFKYVLFSVGVDPGFQLMNILEYPLVLQIVVVFLIQDFLEFFAHFLLHRFDFLWQIHKIHHAQEQLGAASTRHFHWLEYIVFKPLVYLPFNLIGFNVQQYFFLVLTLGIFSSFFTHSNIKLNLGFLNYILNNPETHYWHHAKNYPEKNRYGVNFASVLNIWDVLFGCYYAPKDKTPVLGIDNDDVPKNFFGQMAYPFLAPFKKKNKVAVVGAENEAKANMLKPNATPIKKTTSQPNQPINKDKSQNNKQGKQKNKKKKK